MTSARDIARIVIRRAASADAFATLALSSEIERAGLNGRDAAFATELTMGTLRNQRRIDIALEASTKKGKLDVSTKLRAILRIAAYELIFCDGVPQRASVSEAVAATRNVGGSKMAGFVNALLRRLADSGEPALPDDRMARIAIEHSLPDWLLAEIALEAPDDELEQAAAAMSAIPPLCLRPNRLRTTRAALSERLAAEAPRATLEPHPFARDAIRAARLGSIAQLPSFLEGLFTVQDAGAQRVAELVTPRGVDSILDACAGLGGKTTHLAELFGDSVPIDAIDIAAGKLERLLAGAERLGLSSIRRTIAADLTVETPVDDLYDLVVLDAPCSGLGVVRRHPEAKWRLGPKHSKKVTKLQARLLDACAKRVAPGGQFIYAVCTFAAREGASQVQRFLAAHPKFEATGEMTSWPHRDDADAFFAASMVRRRGP